MDDKKDFLDAMANVVERRKLEREKAKFDRPLDMSKNLAKGDLDKEILPVRKLEPISDIAKKSDDIVKQTPIDEFTKKIKDLGMKQDLKATMEDAIKRGDTGMIKKLQKIASKVGKSATKTLPGIGALVGLATADEASAAVPILDMAENVGPEKGSLESKMEMGEQLSPEEQDMLRQKMEEARRQMILESSADMGLSPEDYLKLMQEKSMRNKIR